MTKTIKFPDEHSRQRFSPFQPPADEILELLNGFNETDNSAHANTSKSTAEQETNKASEDVNNNRTTAETATTSSADEAKIKRQ